MGADRQVQREFAAAPQPWSETTSNSTFQARKSTHHLFTWVGVFLKETTAMTLHHLHHNNQTHTNNNNNNSVA